MSFEISTQPGRRPDKFTLKPGEVDRIPDGYTTALVHNTSGAVIPSIIEKKTRIKVKDNSGVWRHVPRILPIEDPRVEAAFGKHESTEPKSSVESGSGSTPNVPAEATATKGKKKG